MMDVNVAMIWVVLALGSVALLALAQALAG